MKKEFDYIIVGGGIIGVSIAYKLAIKFPKKRILLLEKEKELASHQTGRNSGVIHSGIYYKPGSLKAKNCINGRNQIVTFAQKHKIKYELCGKLIVATNKEELKNLEILYKNGIENGLHDIKYLDNVESKTYEPHINCIRSIHVPYTGIIDFKSVVKSLAKEFLAVNSFNKIEKSEYVKNINNFGLQKALVTNTNIYITNYAIFATGLQSDELAKKDGIITNMKIIGFRGDYYNVINKGENKVKGLIYPVPNINLPFLGVHLTKMYNGKFEAGPNAVFSFKKEGYKRISFSFKDTFNAVTFIGLWKMIPGYFKIGIMEYKRAFNKKAFLRSLQKMIPALNGDEIVRGKSGVRAQALDKKGNLIDDFIIIKTSNSLHILNAPSPAATACLAIADEILNKIDTTKNN